MTEYKNKEWLTLKEASEITGKTKGALRVAIHRKQFVRIKKNIEKGHETWLIHKDELVDDIVHVRTDMYGVQNERTVRVQSTKVNLITLEHYDKAREEWSTQRTHLEQGIMMYRFKFEELDRKLKLLPAPVETVVYEIEEKKKTLAEIQEKLRTIELGKAKIENSLEIERETREKVEKEGYDLMLKVDEEKIVKNTLKMEKEILEDKLAEEKKVRAEIEAELRKEKEKFAIELQREQEIRIKAEKELNEEQTRPWWKKILGLK